MTWIDKIWGTVQVLIIGGGVLFWMVLLGGAVGRMWKKFR